MTPQKKEELKKQLVRLFIERAFEVARDVGVEILPTKDVSPGVPLISSDIALFTKHERQS